MQPRTFRMIFAVAVVFTVIDAYYQLEADAAKKAAINIGRPTMTEAEREEWKCEAAELLHLSNFLL